MICAVVLAAGKSKRMGTQKLLLPWKDSTIIGHIVAELTTSKLDRIIVVTGCNKEAIERALSGRRVSFVHNVHYSKGMLSSVRKGLNALPNTCSAVLVAPGDQPSISHTLVDQMIDVFATTDKRILVPTYQDKRGHPLLLSTDFIPEIRKDFDDTGLRGLLHRYPEEVYEWSYADPDVVLDIDTPEDYRQQAGGDIIS